MSSSESPSPQRGMPSFKIDPKETEPMIKPSHEFGPQLNALTSKEQIIENEFLIQHKRLLVVCKITCLLGLMYIFICALELMSIGFRLIGGKKANNFLKSELISNPLVGVMIGILVTILVQSSSTSTSIIVTMVSTDMIKVRNAIPIVMGANIGTSVTNTLVSFMQPGDTDQFCRAFAAATVHDCFNMLSVLVLLPVECLTHYLEFITDQIIQLIDFEKPTDHAMESKPFIKQITSPLINSIVRTNNHLLEKIRLDNETNLSDSLLMKCCHRKVPQTNSSRNEFESLCIQSCMYILFAKLLIKYTGSIFNYFGLSDWITGLLLLVLAIFLLCVCLIMVVKVLNSMLRGKIANIIKTYINTEYKKPWSYLIGYLALLIGCMMTILVQSSSIFTSNLTLLANLGVISLERIYPLTLGSNIGTTTTGIFAAYAADQSRIKETLQLAFCHLFFNISGILLFYPIPFTRLPISLARKLGKTTAKYRWFSIVYLLFFFLVLPLIIFLLSLAGSLIFMLIIIPIILLLIAIIAINYLQSKYPLMLPSELRTFAFLPIWFRSLDPYDALIVRLAKRIPFLFVCVRPEFRHDLAMTSVLSHNANSRLHILECSRNNSSNEVRSMIEQSRRSSYLADQSFNNVEEQNTKSKFDLESVYQGEFEMWSGMQDISSAALLNMKDTGQQGASKNGSLPKPCNTTIDNLPDKVLLNIFKYLPLKEIGRLARVSKKWRQLSASPQLWTHVSLRPEISGLHVNTLETLVYLITYRFGSTLQYIELPMELITHTVLHELANKCINLTYLLLDFSTAMQLHDFNDLSSFPTKLLTLCICLSEVIFMEGFMRKIYNFINGLEVLHLIGTYEKAVEEEEEEIYEVINIHKLKSAVPNLRVVNLYGINFVDDSHVEAFSSNCIQLECLALNYCTKFNGTVLKLLFQRCKRLKCLLMSHTTLKSEHFSSVDWEKTNLQEIDLTGTELTTECLIDFLTRIPTLRYLGAGQQDAFNDLVMKEFIEKGNFKDLIAFDVDRNENISEEMLAQFLRLQGPKLRGLQLSGIPHLAEQFWVSTMPLLKNLEILIIGMPEGCCQKVQSKVHIDSLIDGIANNCPKIERIEARWDSETLRFSDRSSKAIDAIRIKCFKLKCLVLSDGTYFEMVKSNFDRADRTTVVRSVTNCAVTLVYLLQFYKDLIFN